MTAQLTALPMEAGVWSVSDSRTRVTFGVGHFGHSVHGSVALSWAEVEIDGRGTPVRLRAELDLAGLDTGVARRDSDLRKPRFLDIDRHPTMTWTADRFRCTDDGAWSAEGVISVRGESAPLTVVGRPEPAAVDGSWVRVRAAAVLDRRAVGIRAPSLVIGRRVEIEIDAWLSRPEGAD